MTTFKRSRICIFSLPGAWGLMMAVLLASASLQSKAAPLPRLFPDYVGITLPPNIAPLNFKIQETGDSYRAELRSSQGSPVTISSRSSTIRIPSQAWTGLLHANHGQPLYWDISVQTNSTGWMRFATVTNFIAPEEIDSWLAYRLLKPIYNFYTHLGIYQRNLESFEQKPILQKDKYGEGCLNCHTPLDRSPNTFAFNIRAHEGKSPMILVVSNQPARVEKTMGYLAWHPSGQLLAFSANKFSLLFHTQGEARDVYDANSDLGIYHIDSNTVEFPPVLATTNRNDTWPTWSPDGRFLYFSSTAPQPLEKSSQIRYSLMRVSFDLQTGQFGQPELVISADDAGSSILQPKVSPDGRYLLVTLCKSGNFPIFQSNSDLAVLELNTRKLRRLDINSDQADTWHSWSSNSRWVAFSSKRIDGILARPHFSYVDEHGQFHKPFVLPQEDPSFYGFCLQTFNVPEFMRGPVTLKERDLARTVASPRTVLTPKGSTAPPAQGAQPAQDQSGYQHIRE